MNNTEAILRFIHLPGFGPVKIRRLIEQFGSAEKAFRAETEELAKNPSWKGRWKSDSWKKDLDWIERNKVALVDYLAPEYPRLLLTIPDPPILLYVLGNVSALNKSGIAIIGTRFATSYGLEMASRFSEAIARTNLTVISGLARGIDTAAHKGALQNGKTIAVIGSGLGNIYPPENRCLVKQIEENGAVVSEFPMATPPDKQTFPQRNRIVSGMSRAVLLIEAPDKSGAMITMDLAEQQRKACWAIPGRLDFPSFEGNHKLIRQGKACLASQPEDLLEALGDLFSGERMNNYAADSTPLLTGEELELFKAFPPGSSTMDELCIAAKLSVAKLSILLMSLVMKNIIKEMPGQRYQKKLDPCRKL